MNKLLLVGIIIIGIIAFSGLTYAGYVPILSPLVRPNENSNPDTLDGATEQTLKMASAGMEPTIKLGATISYKETAFESLEVGDIILFRFSSESSIFISRIVEITSDGIKTQGDNNQWKDSWTVTPSCYMGKVVNINNP